ncbi:DUF2924 domain-containing protein [Sphingorhabdus contaminans]|uniref:DUF2924 domain-containing protein n=1 Tax=Sphingorhabdus contaminans TaxID=1343899 RepID=A0A553WA75_9SPHN|nr:DUF2924 domain-containing protein [Sphingorhabdus contaminans]TSB01583.1 DUF2924 domain-containing protein [Sphingorhabdus contaminans]
MAGVRKNGIEAKLVELEAMGISALRDRWAELSDAPLPQVPVRLQRRLIAYRIQERRYGGLPLTLRKAVMESEGHSARKQGQNATSELSPGTCLIREWRGKTISVVVAEDGSVEWEAEKFRSLSEIARMVTGTRWSGPRFFGLGQKHGG